MSTRSVRFFGLVLITALALTTAASCMDDGSNFNEYDNFVAATKRADQEGWKPYWLGRSFTAGGLTFNGPGVGEFGDEIEGGGIRYNYDAKIGKGGVGLDVLIYSPSAWAYAKEIGRTRGSLGATTRDADVAGHDAMLSVSKDAKGFVDQVRADITIDGVIVSAQAGRVTGVGVDGDLNPLTDEATFLAVLDHLRLYPE